MLGEEIDYKGVIYWEFKGDVVFGAAICFWIIGTQHVPSHHFRL
jgi:hypothetical protein